MHPDEVSIHDMKAALDNAALGIRVVDIREPGEYAAAHIQGVMFLTENSSGAVSEWWAVG